MKSSHVIRAVWDAEAGVWVAVSDDVTGLVTEAETMEVLESKIASMVPELMLANGHPVDSATVRLHVLVDAAPGELL